MTDKLTEALDAIESKTDLEASPEPARLVMEAARRWASFPTDEDVEAADRVYLRHMAEHRDPLGNIDEARRGAIRAALEAVKRDDLKQCASDCECRAVRREDQ